MDVRVLSHKDVPEYVPINTDAAKNIITAEVQDKVKVIDAKKDEYVIDKKVVITRSIDTQEYIDSFKDDVGIENILKKFDLCKDEDLFKQVVRPTVPIAEDGMEVVQDYSGIPSSEEDALLFAQKAQQEFSSLPSDLVKGRSFREFAETCTKEELIAYLACIQNTKKEGEDK